MNKLRIESDGTSLGTKVYVQTDDGLVPVHGVRSVSWRMAARDGLSSARLEAEMVDVEAFGFGDASSMSIEASEVGTPWTQEMIDAQAEIDIARGKLAALIQRAEVELNS